MGMSYSMVDGANLRKDVWKLTVQNSGNHFALASYDSAVLGYRMISLFYPRILFPFFFSRQLSVNLSTSLSIWLSSEKSCMSDL
jgi:hypothetical protein